LAAIDNLKNPTFSQSISNDYTTVTTKILSLSPNYGVQAKKDTKPSDFSTFIDNFFSPRSKVLMLCCVSQSGLASRQAVEYCHKVRCLYLGIDPEKTITTSALKPYRINDESLNEQDEKLAAG
jgi:hypothetical protein